MVSLCVVGGQVEPVEKLDSVSSTAVVAAACVEGTVVGNDVGYEGSGVGPAWVVMLHVEVGLVVKSCARLGAALLE